jgi:hypothetical protein
MSSLIDKYTSVYLKPKLSEILFSRSTTMTEDTKPLISQKIKPFPWMNQEFFETVVRDYQKDPNAQVKFKY